MSRKIYNEVVIDMNPESSTFEETLYEDSFEYGGDDIMLVQGDTLEGMRVAVQGKDANGNITVPSCAVQTKLILI